MPSLYNNKIRVKKKIFPTVPGPCALATNDMMANMRAQAIVDATLLANLIEQYGPKCDDEGMFLPRQCFNSNCTCMTPEGIRIPFTEHPPYMSNYDCEGLPFVLVFV